MKRILLILNISILLNSACVKDVVRPGSPPPIENTISSMLQLEVPSNFLWKNTHQVLLNIAISDNRFDTLYHLITIYNDNPLAGGQLIAKGSASTKTPFKMQLNIPNSLGKIFVSKISPDGSEISKFITVTSSSVYESLGYTTKIGKSSIGKMSSPECLTSCTKTIIENNLNITVGNDDVCCIVGSNISVGIVANGGIVKICGDNISVEKLTLTNNAKLIVCETGKITLQSVVISNNTTIVENWGTIIGSSFQLNGLFTNYGTVLSSANFYINFESTLINNGYLKTNNLILNSNSICNNNAKIEIGNNAIINLNSLFNNFCNTIIEGDYTNQAITKNYGYIKVNGLSTINYNSELGMYNGAMFSTNSIKLNGLIKGYIANSLVKVIGNTTIYNTGLIDGLIDYYDLNGIEALLGSFTNGAKENSDLFIPLSTCNNEGNGRVDKWIDSDKDGIVNNLDDYENDSTKSFDNYYPSATEWGTLVFEDQWPSIGDYDMNDVVILYKYNIITNSLNQVVSVKANYQLQASGGNFSNGFGIEFPIDKTDVFNIKGALLEEKQKQAVLVLFNNTREVMQNWNTKLGELASDPIIYEVSFDINQSL